VGQRRLAVRVIAGRIMIVGDAVVLGPILPVDVPSLFQWADDPEDARLNEPYRPHNWQRQEAFWLNAEGDPQRVFFAIRARSGPDIIGYVQILQIDAIHRSAVLGIRIGDRGERGKGRGREALALAIRYCWDQLNLSRLALSVFAGNDRAMALYEALGFREEGRLRQACFIDGAWIDVVLMALLRPDRAPR
jgi:[ribosomal protein S5]-alanine N-acetyltransferase